MTRNFRGRLEDIDGVERGATADRGATTYRVNGTEILRFRGETVVDIRLTHQGIQDRRGLLRDDERVSLRANAGDDWLSVEIRESEDEDLVVELAKAAAQAAGAEPGHKPARS